MKKLLYVFLLFAITSCAKKKWDKESLSDECMKEMGKNKDVQVLSDAQKQQVCDCSADKILVRYKSKSEMEKDDAGAEAIGTECAMQVLMPNTPDNSTIPNSDTTNTADTSNQ